MPPQPQLAFTILCLADRRRNPIARLLRSYGLVVIDTYTTDQAVAICASNRIDAVVLDQEYFIETDGWSVAQSIKLVRPKVCVLLVSRASHLTHKPPACVDEIISSRNPKNAVTAILRLLGLTTADAASGSG